MNAKSLITLGCLGLLALSAPAQAVPSGLESDDASVRAAARLKLEERLVSGARQLTFEGRRAGEGYYSWDGSQMVFQSEREPGNPWYQIYVLDLETGDAERASPGTGKTTCAWIHPDNSQVLFASTHADPDSVALQERELAFRASGQSRRYAWDYDEHFDLWINDRKNGEMKRLTTARGYDAEGCISPDGQWVVFASNRHAYTETLSERDAALFEVDRSLFLDIYRMRIDGTELERLTTARGYDGGPFFSYDGKKICWRRFNEKGTQAEIMTMNADGSGKRKLTAIGAMSWAPYFHPSGEYLIFTTNRHGFANFELYIVDANADEGSVPPVRVTWTPGFDGLPTFTPDGNKLSWTTNRTAGGASQIWLADWNHAAARQMLRWARAGGDDPAILRGEGGATPATSAAIAADDLSGRRDRWSAGVLARRAMGSDDARAASAEIVKVLQGFGLEAGQGGRFETTDTVMPSSSDRTFEITTVHARLAARDEAASKRPPLVIAAGYDLPLVAGDPHAALRTASGLASLFEIAEWLADRVASGKTKLARDVHFVAWAGAEPGARGSFRWITRASAAGGRPAHACIDLTGAVHPLTEDLHGVAVAERGVYLLGVDTASSWRREIERRNVVAGVKDLVLVGELGPGSHASGFLAASVPTLAIGLADRAPRGGESALLDTTALVSQTRLLGLIANGLATTTADLSFTMPQPPQPVGRENLKAWLGTVPDYAPAGIPGLKLSDVSDDGPAKEAGLRGGDILVGLKGEAITDINDYAEIIDTLEVGSKVSITWVRDGKRMTTNIEVRSRK